MAPPNLGPAQRLQLRIPLVYKLLFLWIEPFAALLGSIMALALTDDYFNTMSPRATPLAQSPQFQVVFDQLGATYFLFAFNEMVVLRTTSELGTWKAIIFGIACCDLIHIYGTGTALGGLHTLVNPAVWRWQDWVNLMMLYIPMSLRISFCLGIGIGPNVHESKKRVE